MSSWSCCCWWVGRVGERNLCLQCIWKKVSSTQTDLLTGVQEVVSAFWKVWPHSTQQWDRKQWSTSWEQTGESLVLWFCSLSLRVRNCHGHLRGKKQTPIRSWWDPSNYLLQEACEMITWKYWKTQLQRENLVFGSFQRKKAHLIDRKFIMGGFLHFSTYHI